MNTIISTSGRSTSLRRYAEFFRLAGVDFVYTAIKPRPGETAIRSEDFAAEMKRPGTVGGAISKDIKHGVLRELDQIDPLAQMVQAVNTVINRDGRLTGYNTDASGFKVAIVKAQELAAANKITLNTAVVYGYGGVFGVVANVLKSMGISVVVTGRRPDEAAKRAQEFGFSLYDGQPKDLFINATPVTNFTRGELIAAPGFAAALAGCRIAFDHTMPGESFQQLCAERGIAHVSGTEMYWPQMIAQWQLFMDGYVETSRIETLLREADQSVSCNSKIA